jgi:hypothetical protein
MHSRFGTMVLWLVAMATGPGFVAGLQTKPAESEKETSDKAGVVRLLSVAETTYFQAHGRYATFAELVQSGQIQQAALQSSAYARAFQLLNLQSDPQPIAGFALSVGVASDGRTYHLSLKQLGETCGLGWFSDESGTLYEGKRVDCAAQTAAPVPSNWSPPDIDAVVPPVRAEIPCPLPQILHETSQRAQELVENLQSFAASERIEHIEFGKNGKVRGSTKQVANYTAQIEQSPTGLWVEEYRSGESEIQRPLLTDTGTAAFALIFHPRHVADFDIRCEGQTELQGVPAWQVHFEERDDPTKSFHAIRIDRSTYHLRFKGRAWIARDNHQVLRMQTDLVAPIPKIDLQVEHLEIAYAPVDFPKRKVQLWLPESATLYISYHGHRYERLHQFSRFQLFSVDTSESVKEPHPSSD